MNTHCLLRQLLLFALLLWGSFLPIAPAAAQQPAHIICYFSNGRVKVTPSEGLANFAQNDPVFDYLDSIRLVLGARTRGYIVRRSINSLAYSALDSSFQTMIAINRLYFEDRYFNPEEKKAAVIYMLGHEYAHLIHLDLTSDDGSSRYSNYTHELEADERAGFVLAKLCKVGIHFIEDLLRRVVYTDSFSLSHPQVAYRLLVAKAGWEEGITEGLAFGQRISFQGRSFVRLQGDQRQVLCGEVDPTTGKHIGVWINISPDPDLLYCYSPGTDAYPGLAVQIGKGGAPWLYLGQHTLNQRTGFGTVFYPGNSWFAGTWAGDQRVAGEFHAQNGDFYKGDYSNDLPGGQGRCEYADGSVYSGEWKAGKKYGKGILILSNGQTQNGRWKEDVFLGNGPVTSNPDAL